MKKSNTTSKRVVVTIDKPLTSIINKLPLMKQARKKRKLKAIDELVGLWADKDTSFFDKR